uniref:Uncharacterized protein n=1 Tax=Clastoptera arizonana TaxID=38151 RepID=A0A1B6CYC8_9HEMI
MDENSPDLFSEELLPDYQPNISLKDLPELLNVLNDKNKKESWPQTLHSLFETILNLIPIARLEEELLQFALPAAQNLFQDVILEVNSILKESELENSLAAIDNLQQNLQKCVGLLENLNNMLLYFSSQGKVKITYIPRVPLVVTEILLDTFGHCSSSEVEYGNMLTPMRGKLVEFFQKGHQTQITLLSFLNENLVINCTYEDELEILSKVMKKLGMLGEAIEGLDIKSMVEQWKGYTRLAQTYSSHLRPILDVAQPINFISGNIVNHIKTLITKTSSGDEKDTRRNIKISTLELKVLIKLCELYQDYLGDCQKNLLVLLLHLNLCLPSYLISRSISPALSEDVRKSLYVGAHPLLTHLICDKVFLREYILYLKDFDDRTLEMKVGFLLLTNAILQKITKIDDKYQDMWLQSLAIFTVVLSTLKYCHAALSLDITLDGSKSNDLYESLVINTSVLICGVMKSQDFPHLLELLFEHLTKPYHWPALFVSDLLVLICRFGTSELCSNIVQEMCNVILIRDMDIYSPQWAYITQTTGRLFCLLTGSARTSLLRQYPPMKYVTLWRHLPMSELNQQEKEIFCLDLLQKANADIQNFNNSSADVAKYNSMLYSVSIIPNCVRSITSISNMRKEQLISTLATNVFKLWQCIAAPTNLISETGCPDLQWFYELFSIIISATVVLLSHYSNKQLSFILDRVSDVCKSSSSSNRMSTILFLEELAPLRLQGDQDQIEVFHKISSLFARHLNDKNVYIKAKSLEAFEYFSSITVHEGIVSGTVSGDSQLQNLLTRFMQQLPVTSATVSQEDYLLSQINVYKHKCNIDTKIPTNGKPDMNVSSQDPISGNESTQNPISVKLQEILKDCVSINQHYFRHKPMLSEQTVINKIFEEIDKLKNKY